MCVFFMRKNSNAKLVQITQDWLSHKLLKPLNHFEIKLTCTAIWNNDRQSFSGESQKNFKEAFLLLPVTVSYSLLFAGFECTC